MGVVGLNAVVVGDDNQIAVGPAPAGEGDGAAVGGLDLFAVRGVDVQAGVVVIAAPQVPAAEVGVDPVAGGGPDEVALGGGLGLLLGAHRHDSGGGFPDGGGADDGALLLHSVHIDHVGLHPGLALLPLGEDLGVPDVHGAVLHLLHRALDGLGVYLVVLGLDGQDGDQLLHVEHIPHHQAVDVHIRVQGGQIAHRHVVGVGDGVEGVPFLHRIGGVAGGVGRQGLLHLPHRHLVLHRVHRVDLQIFHKPGLDGVLRGVLGFQLVQHVPQALQVLDHAHGAAVHRHLVGLDLIADLIQLFIEVVLDGPLIAELTFQGEGEVVVHLAVHLIVIAQQPGALGLHRLDGPVHHALVGHHPHRFPVHRHRIAGGVEGGQGEGCSHHAGEQQEGHRPHRPVLGGGTVKEMGPPAGVDAGPLPGGPEIDGPLRPALGPGSGGGRMIGMGGPAAALTGAQLVPPLLEWIHRGYLALYGTERNDKNEIRVTKR